MAAYKFATDSETGTIEAFDWSDAKQQLRAILPGEALELGGWGWVEADNGDRFEVNCEEATP